MGTILDTRSGAYQLVRPAADSTDASFPSRVPTVTAPTGDGVLDLRRDDGASVPNGIELLVVGTGANNATIDGVRVIGWRRLLGNKTTTKDLWVPKTLCEVSGTLGNVTGVANSALGSSYFFADTLSLVTNMGNANVSDEIVSPQNDTIAHLIVDLKGMEKVEVVFDMGSSVTGLNALAAFV